MSRIRKSATAAALAVSVIGGFEGLRLVAYRDSVGVPTVCYGETRGIRMGMTFTKRECDDKFVKALDEFADKIEACNPALKTLPELTYVQHLSLAYNIGYGGYCKSSVARLSKSGHQRDACVFMTKYSYAASKWLAGLAKRRIRESADCVKGLG